SGMAGKPGTSGAGGAKSAGAGDDAGSSGGNAEPMFEDPGTSPWMLVPDADVAEKCGMDPAMLSAADSTIGAAYAVVRYGKLCHEAGTDSPAEVWSATKTLGAVVTGVASYETRD